MFKKEVNELERRQHIIDIGKRLFEIAGDENIKNIGVFSDEYPSDYPHEGLATVKLMFQCEGEINGKPLEAFAYNKFQHFFENLYLNYDMVILLSLERNSELNDVKLIEDTYKGKRIYRIIFTAVADNDFLPNNQTWNNQWAMTDFVSNYKN